MTSTEDEAAASAGYEFRDAMVRRADTRDSSGAPLWYGWAIMDAFLAGAAYADNRRATRSPAVPSEAVSGQVVKPLVWVEEIGRRPETPAWLALTATGKDYRVFTAWWGKEDKWGYVCTDSDPQFFHTPDDAKAAANEDYRKRILSALTPVVVTGEARGEELEAALLGYNKAVSQLLGAGGVFGPVPDETPWWNAIIAAQQAGGRLLYSPDAALALLQSAEEPANGTR